MRAHSRTLILIVDHAGCKIPVTYGPRGGESRWQFSWQGMGRGRTISGKLGATTGFSRQSGQFCASVQTSTISRTRTSTCGHAVPNRHVSCDCCRDIMLCKSMRHCTAFHCTIPRRTALSSPLAHFTHRNILIRPWDTPLTDAGHRQVRNGLNRSRGNTPPPW